jgi:hypothetical protein
MLFDPVITFVKWVGNGIKWIANAIYFVVKFIGTCIGGLLGAIVVLITTLLTLIPQMWAMFEGLVSLMWSLISDTAPLNVEHGFDGAPWAYTLSALDTLLPVREVMAGTAALISLTLGVTLVFVGRWAVREIRWLIMLIRG